MQLEQRRHISFVILAQGYLFVVYDFITVRQRKIKSDGVNALIVGFGKGWI